jgi:hypothetical protein
MGYFILESALFLPGLIAFLVGKIPLSRRRAVNGSAARVVGLLLMIPLPLYLIACQRSHVAPLGLDRPRLDPLLHETEGFVRLGAILAAFGSVLAATVLTIIASETKQRH